MLTDLIRNDFEAEDSPMTQYQQRLPLDYADKATANNTRKAYRQDVQHFEHWGGQLPTDTQTLVRYLHAQADVLNARTLKRRITALKQFHVNHGFPDPTAHMLIKKTLKGIQNTHGKPKQQAPAIRLSQLQQCIEQLQSDNTLISQRNQCLLTLGFFGALRGSELLNIQVEHLDWQAQGLYILIPQSKTDQAGEGQWCALPKLNNALCPLFHTQQWLASSNIEQGHLFRSINRWQQLSTQPLTGVGLNKTLKHIAKLCQWEEPHRYSSHSLRRGLATSASAAGASFKSIMRQGRWQHEGTVLQYIEEGQAFEDNAVSALFE